MNIRRTLISLLVNMFLVGSLLAAQEDGITALKTEGGVLLVWNQPNDYFTLEIFGKDIRPLNASGRVFFSVDGIPFQIQSVPIGEFLKDAGRAESSTQSILAAHRNWESQYIESALGRKLDVRSSPVRLKGEREALFWKFDMPKGISNDAKQQQYLSAVNGPHVLLLNGVVTGGQKEETVRNLLVASMESLKRSQKPINLRELQETLRGSAPR